MNLKESPCDYHAENHTYTDKETGKLLPGVTSILDNMKKDFLAPWAAKEVVKYLENKHTVIKKMKKSEFISLLEEAKTSWRRKGDSAKESGTIAHDWIEQYLLKQDPKLPEDKQAKNAVEAFLNWEKENKVEWLYTELVVGSKTHEFGGKIDAVAILNGRKTLIDFKTSNQISKDYFLQTAAYQLALEEMGAEIEQRFILRIAKNGEGFETLIVPTPYDLDASTFLSLRQVQRWESYIKNKGRNIVDERGKVLTSNK